MKKKVMIILVIIVVILLGVNEFYTYMNGKNMLTHIISWILIFLIFLCTTVKAVKDLKYRLKSKLKIKFRDIVATVIPILFTLMAVNSFINIGKDLVEGPKERYIYNCKFSAWKRIGLFSIPRYNLIGYHGDEDFKTYNIGKKVYEEYNGNFMFTAKIKEYEHSAILLNFELEGKNYNSPYEKLEEYKDIVQDLENITKKPVGMSEEELKDLLNKIVKEKEE